MRQGNTTHRSMAETLEREGLAGATIKLEHYFVKYATCAFKTAREAKSGTSNRRPVHLDAVLFDAVDQGRP
jgi:hypothetical protein